MPDILARITELERVNAERNASLTGWDTFNECAEVTYGALLKIARAAHEHDRVERGYYTHADPVKSWDAVVAALSALVEE